MEGTDCVRLVTPSSSEASPLTLNFQGWCPFRDWYQLVVTDAITLHVTHVSHVHKWAGSERNFQEAGSAPSMESCLAFDQLES